jgi:hypothetical protein
VRASSALLARPRGLDRGVERQQVRLLGDAGDRVDNAADLVRAACEVLWHTPNGGPVLPTV